MTWDRALDEAYDWTLFIIFSPVIVPGVLMILIVFACIYVVYHKQINAAMEAMECHWGGA